MQNCALVKETVAELAGLTGSRADYVRALSALGQGDLPTARTAFERGAETSPVDPRLLAEYGLFELRQGDLNRAKSLIQQAHGDALTVLLAVQELGLNNMAIAEIEPLADTLPGGHAAFKVLATAYRAEGDRVNAAKYQRIIDGSRASQEKVSVSSGNNSCANRAEGESHARTA